MTPCSLIENTNVPKEVDTSILKYPEDVYNSFLWNGLPDFRRYI
jgi:hypothetical protein